MSDANGFGGMKKGASNLEQLDADEIAAIREFERQVQTIFPDSPASRLARACDVTLRTSQKWLNGQIFPVPADVMDFVEEQFNELKATGYVDALEQLVEKGTGQLDPETVAAQLGKAYEKVVGQKIR